MKNGTSVHYQICPVDPNAHLFEVRCEIARPAPEGQMLSLPAWIPGSYMIREFARNIVRIDAECDGKPVGLDKIDKHTWRAAACRKPLCVRYQVYAWDLSVRGAHLDQTHAFFNGTSVFLRVHGTESDACTVDIAPPKLRGAHAWRVATSLPRAGAKAHGFGRYKAGNYDELIDHPVEMGYFDLVSFKVHGAIHEFVVSGRHHGDLERLAKDLRRLCTAHANLFDGRVPVDRYVFLLWALGEGYGGLEHRASTALMIGRDHLPRPGESSISEKYRSLLGLISHEYFHTWNVKRIKPAAFVPYDLTRENYTSLLWAFEGITSYYDDLMLLRSGLVHQQSYLDLLAQTMGTVAASTGRTKQSVADSSFDAWIKYYRQDENAPNAIVSYYAKGSLVALALDLTLRQQTDGRVSLDHVMRELWERHGKTGVGVGEDEFEPLVEQVAGLRLRRFFDLALRSTRDLPLKRLLAGVGIKLEMRAASEILDGRIPVGLGAKTAAEGPDVRLVQVWDDGPARRAGLSAGDLIVALDGLRVGSTGLERTLARYQPGDKAQVHAFRRDELMQFNLRFEALPTDKCSLRVDPEAGGVPARLREAWLASLDSKA